MLINLYLILSMIFGGAGLNGASSYFDGLALSNYQSFSQVEEVEIAPFDIYNTQPFGLKETGLSFKINAKAASAIDIENAQVLYIQGGEERLVMASLTKVMTATIALENIRDFNTSILVSRDAALVEGSKMHLWIDEKISLRDVLYGLILKSGNDAAVSLQEYYDNVERPRVAGVSDKLNCSSCQQNQQAKLNNAPTFIQLMNQKAEELGMKNSHFEDSSGISDNNTTTVYDLTILMNYAMRNKTFSDIMATPQYTAQAINGSLTHPMSTTNRLLRTRTDVLGGKTGYSEAAGYNMITIFRAPNGHRIVTVVLGSSSEDSRFDQTNRIIDWAYNYYRY